jgi:hypothetical protein
MNGVWLLWLWWYLGISVVVLIGWKDITAGRPPGVVVSCPHMEIWMIPRKRRNRVSGSLIAVVLCCVALYCIVAFGKFGRRRNVYWDR